MSSLDGRKPTRLSLEEEEGMKRAAFDQVGSLVAVVTLGFPTKFLWASIVTRLVSQVDQGL
jgi:hypothetical protein